VLLNIEVTRGLPEVVSIGEEDGLGADGLGNRLDSGDLLSLTGNGGTVGQTSVGPAGLEVDDVLAATDLLEDSELRLGKLTGLLGGDIGVEEGVDVGTDDVYGAAKGGSTGLLPNVNGLGGGHLAGVTGSREAGFGGLDEGTQGGGIDVAGLDGLVTDDNQLNHAPLSPLGNGGDLLLGTGNTGALNVDTEDHVEAELLAGVSDELEAAAVSGVDTDEVESLVLDDLDVLEDLLLGLAVARLGVGGVSHTVLALTGDSGTGGRGGGSNGAAGGHNGGSSGGSGSGSRGGDSGSSGGGSQGALGGGRADVGVVSLGHSHGGASLGVGAGGDGLRGGVDQNGAGGHNGGGGRNNGVSTGSGASVGGGLNNAGHGGTGRLDSGVRAGDDGVSGDNGGNTAVGVGTAGNLSGGGTADGGAVGDGDSGSRDGVDTGGGEGADTGGRQVHGAGASGGSASGGTASRGTAGRHRSRGGRGRHGHSQGAGASGVHSAGESAGRLWDGRRSSRRAGGGHGDQGRLAVVGDNLGCAATSLIGVQRGRGARSHA
jgi:hypothetical protein